MPITQNGPRADAHRPRATPQKRPARTGSADACRPPRAGPPAMQPHHPQLCMLGNNSRNVFRRVSFCPTRLPLVALPAKRSECAMSTARKLSHALSPSLGFCRPRVLLIGIGIFFSRCCTNVRALNSWARASCSCSRNCASVRPVQFGQIQKQLSLELLGRNLTLPTLALEL